MPEVVVVTILNRQLSTPTIQANSFHKKQTVLTLPQQTLTFLEKVLPQ
jgi:hypothetical protein